MKRLLLLLNMGGPNNLSEVEVFLKNMFNDPCILGIKNKFLRKFIAFMITRSRLKEATHNYKQIGGKSPICEITQKLCGKISSLSDEFDAVDFAMNYTPPFAKEVLKKYENFDEIIVLPLYPHHSITTVVSSLNDFNKAFEELNLKAKVKIIEPFYKDELYNQVIVNSIKNMVRDLKTEEITLIFSAHSLPQKIIDNGDVYEKHTLEHVEILSDLIGKEMKFKEIRVAYQSRLGPVKWLEPALGDELAKLENKKALIYPISFCIDNSESVFELAKEYKDVADELKFEYYDVVACPNDSEEFAKFLIQIALK
ncbi:ferrochelatase [Campylobacter sp. MOP51]|uniref:ferrochelatase n=1 Tax=Campylobacter canis TaxID=3378588 RepID=UPI003C5EA018